MGVSELHSRIVRFGLNTSVPSQDLYTSRIPLLSPNQWCPSTKEGQTGPAPPPLSDGCKFPHVVPPSLPPPSLSLFPLRGCSGNEQLVIFASRLSGGQLEVYIYTHTRGYLIVDTTSLPSCAAVAAADMMTTTMTMVMYGCASLEALVVSRRLTSSCRFRLMRRS